MELFNIVVGIANIIAAICSIISVKILNSLYININTIKSENNNLQSNAGLKNSNNVIINK